MDRIIFIIVCFLAQVTIAQQAFHNYGNIQIHDQGEVGFHTDLINDGTFDQNLGLVGFYNPTGNLNVSGDNRPIFHNMEIDVVDDLLLDVAVGVTNFQEFINGRVQTPRDRRNVSLDYINDAPYLGENDDRYVDGYSSITGVLDFTFPIGDDFRLRPMRIENQAAVNTARGAYFFENPNSPNFFSTSFNTDNFSNVLFGVSSFEFWDLDGDVETRVTLTWDDNSNIPTLVDELEDLRVVGWDRNLQQWVSLGNFTASGDLNSGEITSELMIPDNYVVLTFGSSDIILDGDLEIFTAVSPNGDGVNDTFIIQGIEQFSNNELIIYNRWGVEVYRKKGYDNSWGGYSEGRATIAQDEQLPVGTYYYILKIEGQKDRAGYLYINV
ncbi:gliding motility-associated-like protein [Aquimarina sp. EL_43]|uniref:gliding motility-associated C-terminal domain-containing protein n=1 Tax=Aquimarina TaxID=290174 RepID=UPI0004B71D19|nr:MULTISPECIES: T9SS C-terminal target domain-containing protein [Aquimarina]MBG6131197.1 gliding motility-associated-like protein [Aquimarina sp. EL_35]MBG6151921.1 gliding motility-associated-like protein [Aquimarina sp. EL_32]MBG6169851.1 gliding motility-associated-like protein [Aquimarina sp. EL_43]